jgi:hypothetical protein
MAAMLELVELVLRIAKMMLIGNVVEKALLIQSSTNQKAKIPITCPQDL